MKRIFFVTQHYEPKGISFTNVMTELAKRFTKAGYEVVFLTTTHEKSHFKHYDYASVKRFKVFRPPAFGSQIIGLEFAFKLKKYMKENLKDTDIIIANGPTALGLPKESFILRVSDQPPNNYDKNMSIMPYQKLETKIGRRIHCISQRLFEIIYMNKAKAFIYSSEENRDEFNKEYKLDTKPEFIPRSGVNCDMMKGAKKMKRRKPNPSILFVGSGDERVRKGIRDLEDCLPHIFDHYEDCKLIHVGKPFKWNLYSRHVGKVISVGKVPHEKMVEYYKNVSFIVSTSMSEGFPNVLLEAMAAGCPIITSDIDGINEYLADMESAYIYKRGDTVELVKALQYMLDQPKKAEAMAKKAQKFVQRLDYDNYFENLLKFIKEKKSINLLK